MRSSVGIIKVNDSLEVEAPEQRRITLPPGKYQISPYKQGSLRPLETPKSEVKFWILTSNGITHGILSAEEAEIAEKERHISWLA